MHGYEQRSNGHSNSSGRPDMSAKQKGYATDSIAIRSESERKLFATNLNVRFSGSSARRVGDSVDVFIDGLKRLTMTMQEGGACAFRGTQLQPDPAALGGVPGLYDVIGPHPLRFEHRYYAEGECRVSYVEAFLWVWDYSDSLVVSDVDGTITKSDVGGMINGVLGHKLGWKKGHAHAGVCRMYNDLLNHTGARMLYLTARPMNLIVETRAYIYELEQVSWELGRRATHMETHTHSLIRSLTNSCSTRLAGTLAAQAALRRGHHRHNQLLLLVQARGG